MRPTASKFRVWQHSGTRFDVNNTISTFQSVYTSLSVWAAFSAKGQNPLVPIAGKLKQEQYCNILTNNIIYQ